MNQHNGIKTEKALFFHRIIQTGLEITNSYTQEKKIALTVHSIKESATGQVIGAGQLLSEVDKQELRDYLNAEDKIKSHWLPKNLLMLNSSKMIWYVPAKKRAMYVKIKGETKTFNIVWPSLVFLNKGDRTLNVAAYAGNGRPNLTQKLYHAPLWNIYNSTSMCNGSADTTAVIGIESMKVWESALFDTVFTHKNHDHVLAKKNHSYLAFLRRKERSGDKIKTSEMTPLNETLESWVEKME